MLHISDSNYHEGATLSELDHIYVSQQVLSSFFLLINTLLASLLSVLVGILSCKVKGPSLTDHWSSG